MGGRATLRGKECSVRRFRLVAATILSLILAGVMSAIGLSNALAASGYGFIDVDPDD